MHNIFREAVELFGEDDVRIAPGTCLINASLRGDELRLDEDPPAFLVCTNGKFSSFDFLEHHLSHNQFEHNANPKEYCVQNTVLKCGENR